MIRKLFVVVLTGAGLMACSSHYSILVPNANAIQVDTSTASNRHIDSIISPYRQELEKEMNEVVAFAAEDFLVERPCGSLNNWVADAVLASQIENLEEQGAAICLLNTGGIRANLNRGPITMADIFKVMPFDNVIVCVRMPLSSRSDIEEYIQKKGGQPIAGAFFKKGILEIPSIIEQDSSFWIVTSDYLLEGGDHMDFFKKNSGVKITSVLLREALITKAREEKQLIFNADPRIIF
jgi:2',3'-cyclic-nucleotide 2'-phosphodiesterase (5'-nucleotidase family)